MQLTPSKVRQLIELSLITEPLLDKKDCTTRYVDLPGKPLQDFLIASINVGVVFEEFAQSILDGNTALFSHFYQALSVSNQYKSPKTINFGLVLILLIAVQAVLHAENVTDTVVKMNRFIRESNHQDVMDELRGLEFAWSTSTSDRKHTLVDHMKVWFEPAQSYYERCTIFRSHLDDPAESNFQVMEEIINGFPTLSRFLTEVDDKKGLMKSLEDTYNAIYAAEPIRKIGWLADLCACAGFIYLAFQDESYQIR